MAFVSYENLQLYTTKMKGYVDGKIVTYTFTEDTTAHTLTITGTDGTSKVIQLGEDITKEKIISGLGFTPADEDDIPTTLAELTGDTTHRVVTDAEKESWNAKAEVEDIPTSVSELTNDSGFIKLAADDTYVPLS